MIPRLLLSAYLLALVSCVHTAMSPVSTPGGVPVVIKIPHAKPGKVPSNAQMKAITNRLMPNMDENMIRSKYFWGAPEGAPVGVGIVGIPGDAVTLKGERFVGYLPIAFARSTLPPAEVERAAAKAAADFYRTAKKSYDVVPTSELKKKPSKKS